VLIGAYGDKTGASSAGAAYLYSTSGTLLTTFTNPFPAVNDNFGWAVSGVGTDKVLIGTPNDDTGAIDSGAADLFTTNGTLLTTITNPTPEFRDNFGSTVAAMGTNRIIIGAHLDNIGAADSGVAYLVTLSQTNPKLTIARTITNTIEVAWPSSTEFVLQMNTNNVSSVNWSNVMTLPVDNGTTKSIIIDTPTGSRFYRLIKP